MKRNTCILIRYLVTAVAGLVLSSHHRAEAALLMYEGFPFGTDDGVVLTTISGSAFWLDGTSYTGSTNVRYQSAGLTLGGLVVAGGNSILIYNAGASNATRGPDFDLTSGTLYGSCLILAYTDSGGDRGISPVMFAATVSDNAAQLAVAGNTANTVPPGVPRLLTPLNESRIPAGRDFPGSPISPGG